MIECQGTMPMPMPIPIPTPTPTPSKTTQTLDRVEKAARAKGIPSPDNSYSNTVSAATLGSGAHVRALEDRAIPGVCGWKWGVSTRMEGQVLAGKPVHDVPVPIGRRGPFKPAFQRFSTAREAPSRWV